MLSVGLCTTVPLGCNAGIIIPSVRPSVSLSVRLTIQYRLITRQLEGAEKPRLLLPFPRAGVTGVPISVQRFEGQGKS